MRILHVYIELNGLPVSVGRIRGNSGTDAVFSYDPDFLKREIPISVSLPLQREPFSARRTRCFFEGLLPEGFTRRSVAQWMHVDENDYLSILAGLGKECLGAIRIEEESGNKSEACAYEELSIEDVRRLAAEGATRSAEIVVKSHLSLTGASGKVGLYYDQAEKKWYQPLGTAPSTHIVKQSHVRLSNIVENEQLILRTAANLGIAVAKSFIIHTGRMDDAGILLATERYDRDRLHTVKNIGGLPVPLRLHQEDLGQALGIVSEDKYEKPGEHYLADVFDLVKRVSSDPLRDQLKLLDVMIFDVLIGNTDNHIKNLSLLYRYDLQEIRLAPAYDLVSTLIYREGTSEMSIAVAGVREWEKINRSTFAAASSEVGIRKEVILREYDRLRQGLPEALNEAAEELSDDGFQNAGAIKEAVVKACRI
ncbi:MAG TPA: type II toxin-antitoxin system HipA family toxin [Lachnospiraceae bacterium]|nr:type II toxin-antitoxin system HipA family toxin [Lachnospiraceae bacterium]